MATVETLIINYLTEEQYKTALANNELDENEIYLISIESVERS